MRIMPLETIPQPNLLFISYLPSMITIIVTVRTSEVGTTLVY